MTITHVTNLGIAVGVLNKNFHIIAGCKMEELGLAEMEGAVLNSIHNNPSETQDFHAAYLGYDKGTVARNAAKLEEKGLISRERDKQNKRKYLLDVTERGKKTAQTVCEKYLEIVDIMTKSIGSEKSKLVLNYLDKINKRLEEEK